VPSTTNPRRRAQEVRSFASTKAEILALAAWLRSCQVTRVVMEPTSDYWKSPFFRLEAEGFDCDLLDAKQVKALPGRPKTDRADCARLAKVAERGMVASCSVPPEEIRRLRTLSSYRRHLTEERSREKARADKLLEDALLKLSVVVSDLHGVSSREMMEALISGCRAPRCSPRWPRAGCGPRSRRWRRPWTGPAAPAPATDSWPNAGASPRPSGRGQHGPYHRARSAVRPRGRVPRPRCRLLRETYAPPPPSQRPPTSPATARPQGDPRAS